MHSFDGGSYPRTVNARRYRSSGEVEPCAFTFTSRQDELAQLQQGVGGYIEALGLGDGTVLLFDEDGKTHDRPVNQTATRLATQAGALFTGDALLGEVLQVRYDDEGEITSMGADE